VNANEDGACAVVLAGADGKAVSRLYGSSMLEAP